MGNLRDAPSGYIRTEDVLSNTQLRRLLGSACHPAQGRIQTCAGFWVPEYENGEFVCWRAYTDPELNDE